MKWLKPAWVVAQRELIDHLRDWRILAPMIILTLVFPYLMTLAAKVSIQYINKYGGNLIASRMLPFLILVVGYFPVTISLVVALEAFVGEKERGTIEPLLASPLSDEQLYLGKLIAGTLVPITVSFTGIGFYMAGLAWQGIAWPEASFIFQTLALTAVQTLLMVSAAIVISTQSTTVRAANLLASFIIIPVAALIQGESIMMFWGNSDILWLAVLGVSIMSLLTIRLGIIHFKRENLLGREIDVLNWSWVWQTFRRTYSSETRQFFSLWSFQPLKNVEQENGDQNKDRSPGGTVREGLNRILHWYRVDLMDTLQRLAPTIWVVLVIGIMAVLAGYIFVQTRVNQTVLTDAQFNQTINSIRGIMQNSLGSGITTKMIFWHNLQAELIILLLGVFTFGILSIVVFIGNFALIGGILGVLPAVGLSPWLVFISGILPHGIFEMTSIILLSAAMLHLGLRLVTPEKGRSIGETLIMSLADVTKLLIGICIPFLILAAVIEANITPRLLITAVGHYFNLQP